MLLPEHNLDYYRYIGKDYNKLPRYMNEVYKCNTCGMLYALHNHEMTQEEKTNIINSVEDKGIVLNYPIKPYCFPHRVSSFRDTESFIMFLEKSIAYGDKQLLKKIKVQIYNISKREKLTKLLEILK